LVIESLGYYYDGTLKAILVNALRSKDERVRAMAAFHWVWQDMYEEVSQVVIEGHTSQNPHIHALSILTVWGEKLFYAFFFDYDKKVVRQERVEKYFPLMLQSLQNPSHVAQLAALTPIAGLHKYYKLDIQKIIPIVKKMKNNPMMHYDALVALGEMGDMKTVEEIGMNPKVSFLERAAVLMGMLRLRTGEDKHYATVMKAYQIARKIVMEDPDKRVQGLLIYIMCYYIPEVHRFLKKEDKVTGMTLHYVKEIFFPSMLKGGEIYIAKVLQDPDPFLRLYGIISIVEMERYTPEMVKVLKKIWKEDSKLHIRAMSLGVLTYIYYKQKQTAELQELYSLLKQSKNPEEEKAYMWGMVWGYYQVAWNIVRRTIDKVYESHENPFAMRYLRIMQFKHAAMNPENRQHLLACLERIHDILKNEQSSRSYSDYDYILAVLYGMEGTREKAIEFVSRRYTKRQDIYLAVLWSGLLREEGKLDEAFKIIQSLRQNIVEKHLSLSPHEASAITRELAKIHHARNDSQVEVENLFLQQYIVCPNDLMSLVALGEYYLDKKKYLQARLLFEKVLKECDDIGEAVIGKARALVGLGETKIAGSLAMASQRFDYLQTSEQWKVFPEFAKLDSGVLCWEIARWHGVQKDMKRALQWLKEARKNHYPISWEIIQQCPDFGWLCQRPGFQKALMEK
jgi:tetratricopeptide (TPR) repeat protein